MNNSTTSDSASEAGRQKPYRIKITSGTVRRHDRSFESSGTETEVRFSAKGRAAAAGVNYKRLGPLDIRPCDEQDYHHPYAHQPTPFEKLQEFFADCGENSWMLAYEVMGWIVDKVWGLIVAVILLPIALLGLLLDCLRRKVDKVSFRMSPSNQTLSIDSTSDWFPIENENRTYTDQTW